MKKLKTWQIVLLVIFYPIGICVWIYRVWKKDKLKRDAAAAASARPGSKRTRRCGASGSVARKAGSAGNVEIQGCRRDVQKRGREKPSNASTQAAFRGRAL